LPLDRLNQESNLMTKLHVTQDKHGFWMLSVEHPDGKLQLLAHHFISPQHLIQDASEMASKGDYRGAVVVIDPPNLSLSEQVESWPEDYQQPEPKKAGQDGV
jgi:hypothetical protein